MGKNQEKILIPAGTMINRGLHEDDDYLIANTDLIAIVLQHLPSAVQVIIPQIIEDFAKKFSVENLPIKHEIFYIHQPN
ncbi:MAG: hypothetical protein GX943_03135 [Candidatus Pacebacteria bacterium]|jgi:hypothetical protein|nr:hypothetical protein [Candidatus Paceibacterota bacterium]